MEINLFSKCIEELIVENDRVDVPYLGTFVAEMMPASYSDRQTTINPPYRRMTFHKADITLADGHLLLDKVRKELGVSLDQAGVELGWCLSRLCSELEGRKICKLPGLGVMRANARNEFFFVSDDDLDIWPDGIGFEPISIKVAEKMPDQVGHDVKGQVGHDAEGRGEMPDQAGHDVKGQAGHDDKDQVGHDEKAGERGPGGDVAVSERPERDSETQNRVWEVRHHRRMRPWVIAVIGVAAVVVLFIAACYLFTEEMSPILDPLLYSKEELELLRGL